MIVGRDGASQVLVFFSWLNRTSFVGASKRMPWIRRRFELWKRTALASIQRQSVREWRYVLVCDPGVRHLTAPLQAEIKDPRVQIIHDGEEERAFRASLPEAQRYIYARLDSDDRYHPRVGSIYCANAHRTTRARPYLQFSRGYAHEIRTGKLYAWSQSSSPFFALVMGPEFRTLHELPLISHSKVGGIATKLGGACFVVSLHDHNTTTTSSTCCVGNAVPLPAARQVGKRFELGKVVGGRKPLAHIRPGDLPAHQRIGVRR